MGAEKNRKRNNSSDKAGRAAGAKTGSCALELPYERFLAHGAHSLTNAELLAIILRTGTAGCSAVETGQRVLSLHGNSMDRLSILHSVTMRDLLGIPGVGEVKAVKILCLAEISRRIAREKAGERPILCSPDTIAGLYMEELRHLPNEQTILLYLDNKMALMGEDILSLGTVNCALLSVREIFRRSLQHGAVNIVLLHNHPSGDPTPSRQDILITRQIQRAGELVEIPLTDHIIIGDLSYVSMKAHGYLEHEESTIAEQKT